MTHPEIGQTMYEVRVWSYGKKRVPCPVCYGKLFAVLELGNGERVPVECDACDLGYDGPRGWINEHAAGSSVTPFVVFGILQHGDEWKALDASGSGRVVGVEVFATVTEAEAQRAALYAEEVKESDKRNIQSRDHLRKKPTWLVRYHREQIRLAERQLKYSTQKLSDALARQRKPEVV